MYDGILLIDKPSGWTSFDVVNYVRGMIARAEGKKPKQMKVGHTGTLDPLATGLLVLVLGSYCKRAQEFSKLNKTYEVTMTLGSMSSTGDEEGEKIPVSDKQPSSDEVTSACQEFIGEIFQTPPQYSAIKVSGRRAYKLARAGQEVKLEARKVKVYAIQLTAYSYPEVKFVAEVSSGTYIRSLVEDIGKSLGTGAYMSGLVRTSVGQFNLDDAVQVDQLDAKIIGQKLITVPGQSS